MIHWTKELAVTLQSKTDNYTDQEKQNFHIDYLKNLLSKIEQDNLIIESSLQSTIEAIIHDMPIKINDSKLNYKSQQLNKITNLQTTIRQQFNLVKKKHFSNQYLALGIGLGMCFGLPIATAIGNIALGPALGLPFGLCAGLLIGQRLDNKAAAENRVL
jgi:hypothetical protein